MASAMEMLSGEKKRLPLPLRNWPYRAAAKALFPSTTAARSAADGWEISAAHAATGAARQAMMDGRRKLIRITCETPEKGRLLDCAFPSRLLIPAKELYLRRPYGTPYQVGGISFPRAKARG